MKYAFKLANEDVGPFNKGSDLIEQGVVFNRTHAAAGARGRIGKLPGDHGLALREAGNHSAVFFKRDCISISVIQDNGRHGRFKAMTMRRTA
jgi:hypothetical protein